MNADCYALLGVERDADLEAIRRAYRKRAVECHPDHGGSNREMQLINTAWEVLSNPELRKCYDEAFAAKLAQLIKLGQPSDNRERAASHAGDSAWAVWLAGSSVAVYVFLLGGGLTGALVADWLMQNSGLLSVLHPVVTYGLVGVGWVLGTEIGERVLAKLSSRLSSI